MDISENKFEDEYLPLWAIISVEIIPHKNKATWAFVICHKIGRQKSHTYS